LIGSNDVIVVLREMALASILEQVAVRPVDAILTTGKQDLEQAVKQGLNERLVRLGFKIQILSVERRSVAVPYQVKGAFQDVISAQEEKRAAVHGAETYRNRLLPKSQGEAERMIQEAEAERFRRVSAARGEADRFLKLMAEYRLASRVTRRRLLIEMVEETFPRVKVLVLASDRHGKPMPIKVLQDPLPTSPRLQ
jgi:membrane protease subunit HflK